MPFDSSSIVSEEVTETRVTRPHSIEFVWDAELATAGVPPFVDVKVTKMVGGERQTYQLPRQLVVDHWPGTSKSLRSHLLTIYNAAG